MTTTMLMAIITRIMPKTLKRTSPKKDKKPIMKTETNIIVAMRGKVSAIGETLFGASGLFMLPPVFIV